MNQLHPRRDGPPVGGVGQPEGVSDGQHGVGFAVYHQGRAGGVLAAGIHAAAEGKGVVLRERAFAHQRAGNGHRQKFGQLQGLVPSLRRQHSAAHVHYRKAGIEQYFGGAVNVHVVGRGLAAGADRLIAKRFVGGFRQHHVQGHLQHHRSRGTGPQVGKGPADHRRNVLNTGEGPLPLDQVVEDAGGDFLLNLPTHAAQRVLAHKKKHRDIVGERPCHSGQGVRGAGPGARQRHPDLAGGPGVTVGYLHAHALVPG